MAEIVRKGIKLFIDGKEVENSLKKIRGELAHATNAWAKATKGTDDYIQKSKKVAQLKAIYQEHIQEQKKIEKQYSGMSNAAGGFFEKIKLGAAVFAGNMMTKGIEMLGKLTSKAKEFIATGMEMANKAEGVQTAFNKLNQPDLLKNLRLETKGLVTDFQLMQSAVKASNFKIPLEQLGTLLKFAQQRAQETGESVDYLVESIINGIGRKSPLILDNLGISAVELQKRVKISGDFMKGSIELINEELKKQGDLALTSADKATQAAVKWENAQLLIGKRFQWLGNLWNSISGSIADGIAGLVPHNESLKNQYENQIQKVADLEVNTMKLVDRYKELKTKTALSKDEQVELGKVINSLNSAIPGIITKWDDYGRAIEINTEKIYEFIKAEKLRFQYLNKDVINQTKKDIKSYEKKLELAEKYQKGLESERDLIKKNIGEEEYIRRFGNSKHVMDRDNEASQRISDLKNYLSGAKAQLKELEGTTWEEQVEMQKKISEKRNEFNAMEKKALDQWIKDKKNANNEYLQLAKQIYDSRFPTEDNTELKKQPEKDDKKDRISYLEMQAAKARILAMQEVQTQQELEDRLLEIERDLIKQKQALYDEDTLEYEKYKEELEKYDWKEKQNKLKQIEAREKAIRDLEEKYRKEAMKTDAKKAEEELRILKETFDEELQETERYLKLKQYIIDKYDPEKKKLRESLDGVLSDNKKFEDKKSDPQSIADLDKEKKALEASKEAESTIIEAAFINNLLSEEEYQNQKQIIIDKYNSLELEKDKEKQKAKLAIVQFGLDQMSMLLNAASSYVQASQDAEVAAVEAKYDKQIKAAGKNQKKVASLEKKKEEEAAKVRAKYQEKAFAIQIAQAIASTAMAAINAYSSAAAIPVVGTVLAPIAAGIALAAGALQIAAIKKQNDAAKANYYTGGFTPSGPWDKPQGVVHSEEFIANRFATSNPMLRPVFDVMDYAQRNNTISSLGKKDIARALGMKEFEVGGYTSQTVVNNNTQDTSSSYIEALILVIDRLNKKLEEPFVGEVSVTGKRGIKENMDLYDRMIKNASR